MRSPLEQFDIINIKSFYLWNMDLTIQNILIPLICIIICIVIYIFLLLDTNYFISLYIHNILESIYKFIVILIKQQSGSYGLFWLPFIFNLFNFIFLCNLVSLIPYGIALTSQFILIFWLSCTICTSIFLIGLLRFHLKFLHIFIPKSPFLLLPLLIPIEIFSYLIRLLSLAIRLAANLIAGHTLVHIIINFFGKILLIDKLFGIFILIPLLFIAFLELCIAFLQAYVFTVLFCIYLKDTEYVGSH